MKKNLYIKILALIIVICAGFYWFATSSFFLKSFVLPRVGGAIGGKITADSISLSLLRSSLGIKNLNVEIAGTSFISSADFDCDFNTLSIIKGVISIESLTLANAKIMLSKDSEGWTPRFTTEKTSTVEAKKNGTKRAKPLCVDIKKTCLKDVEILCYLEPQKNNRRFVDLCLASLSVDSVKNNSTLSVKCFGGISFLLDDDIKLEKSSITGDVKVRLSESLLPLSGDLALLVDKLSGQVKKVDLKGRTLSLEISTEQSGDSLSLKRFLFNENVDGRTTTSVSVAGSVNPSPLKICLDLKIDPISSELLNVASSLGTGMTLGEAALSHKGRFEYCEGKMRSQGELRLINMSPSNGSLAQTSQDTYDCLIKHDVSYAGKGDESSSSSHGHKLEIGLLDTEINQKNGGDFKLGIGEPFKIELDDKGNITSKDKANLCLNSRKFSFASLTHLFSKDKQFDIKSGYLDGCINVVLDGDKKEALSFIGDLKISDFCIASTFFSGTGIALNTKIAAHLEGLSKVRADTLESSLAVNGNVVGKFSGEGEYSIASKSGTVSISEFTVNDKFLTLLPSVKDNASLLLYAQQISNSTVSCSLKSSFDLSKTKTANLEVFNLSIAQNEKELAVLAIESPALLDFSNPRFLGGDINSKLSIHDLTIKQILPFIVKDDAQPPEFKFSSGTFGCTLGLQIGRTLDKVKIDCNANLIDLGFKTPSATFSNLALSLRTQCVVNDKELLIDQIKLVGRMNEEELINMTGGGSYNFVSKTLAFRVPELVVKENSFALIPGPLSKDQKVFDVIKTFSPCHLKTSAAASVNFNTKSIMSELLKIELIGKGKPILFVAAENNLLLCWDPKEYNKSKVKLNMVADSLDLAIANLFIPKEKGFKINAGVLDGVVSADIGEQVSLPAITGKINVKKMSYSLNGETFSNINITQDIDAKIDYKDGLAFRPFYSNTDASVNADKVVIITTKGDFDITQNHGKGSVEIKNLNERIFQICGLKQISEKIKKLSVDANSTFEYDKSGSFVCNGKALCLSSAIIGENDDACVSNKSELSFDISKSADKKLRIGEILLDVSGAQGSLANLIINGTVFLQPSDGQSNIIIKSNRIDLLAIQNTFSGSKTNADTSSKEPIQKSDGAEQKEPEPLNIKDVDLVLNLDLNNVTYGESINSSLKSDITVKNCFISASPVKVKLNNAPIIMSCMMDVGQAAGWPFVARCEAQDILLGGILKQFMKDTKDDPQGTIKSFNLNMKGKGFSVKNLASNLNASFSTEMTDIMIPASAKNIDVINIIYVPLSAMSEISPMLPASALPGKIPKAISLASNALKESKSLSFKTASISAETIKKRIRLSKCQFIGAGEAIRKISMLGWFDYSGEIDLESNSVIGGLTIPLSIGGTIKQPKPNMKTFVPLFIKSNAENIITTDNVIEVIKDPKKGVNKVLDTLLDGGSGTTSGSSTSGKSTRGTSTSPGVPDEAKQLINTLDGLLEKLK